MIILEKFRSKLVDCVWMLQIFVCYYHYYYHNHLLLLLSLFSNSNLLMFDADECWWWWWYLPTSWTPAHWSLVCEVWASRALIGFCLLFCCLVDEVIVWKLDTWPRWFVVELALLVVSWLTPLAAGLELSIESSLLPLSGCWCFLAAAATAADIPFPSPVTRCWFMAACWFKMIVEETPSSRESRLLPGRIEEARLEEGGAGTKLERKKLFVLCVKFIVRGSFRSEVVGFVAIESLHLADRRLRR